MTDLKRAARNTANEDAVQFATKLQRSTLDAAKAYCKRAGFVLWRWLDKTIKAALDKEGK